MMRTWWQKARRSQGKYLAKYGLVLVTNLRQFILLARVDGKTTELEIFTIAATEKDFWKAI